MPGHARADRRQRRGHRHRRGPRAVQGGDDRDRPRRARARGIAHTIDEARDGRRGDRPAGHHPPGLHPRRAGHRHRRRRSTSSSGSPPPASTPARSARSSSRRRSPAGRSSSSRSCATAPTTAWSSARSRTSTRWACTPATRSPSPRPRRCPTSSTSRCATPPSPASAGSASRPAARTCSSRSTPTNGDMVVIEMNPRVSRVVGAGLEGDRVPDRQDRRPAGRRLHARRDPQRHHPQDAGQLRADHRLRGHQDPALGVREAARHAGRARHPDAVGGRGDGHRPHVPREPAEGAALAGDRAASGSTATRPRRSVEALDDDELLDGRRRRHARPLVPARRARCGAASRSRRVRRRAPGSTRGSSTRWR